MPQRLAFWGLAALVWTGCARGVGPRPPLHTGGNARIIGCLDIDVEAQSDRVLTFDLANRCAQPVALEFRNVVMRAWSPDGSEYHATPSDPRHELFQAQLDGHRVETVVLAFPVAAETPRFCVDIARLNVDQPAPSAFAPTARRSSHEPRRQAGVPRIAPRQRAGRSARLS